MKKIFFWAVINENGKIDANFFIIPIPYLAVFKSKKDAEFHKKYVAQSRKAKIVKVCIVLQEEE